MSGKYIIIHSFLVYIMFFLFTKCYAFLQCALSNTIRMAWHGIFGWDVYLTARCPVPEQVKAALNLPTVLTS